MSAERAARKIVAAVRRGDAEVTLGIQAKLLRLVHDLMPQLTIDLLALVNRLLPYGEGGAITRRTRGLDLRGEEITRVTELVERDARRYNQHNGHRH